MTISKVPPFLQLPPVVRAQFEKLASSIVIPQKKQKLRSIVFMSYNHGEGTSTIVKYFAESLALGQKHNVLVVDANTRTPSLGQRSNGNEVKHKFSFSDLFTGQIEDWALPKPSPDSNFSTVPSGDITYHPSQVFDHEQFDRFIDSAKKLFHFVIFDSSPIGLYYDSIVLSSHVDGVILVVQAERTQPNELKRAKQMLHDSDIPVLGVVLNRRRFRIPAFVYQRFFG
ncbi:MAG: CpsD/CapB family tyrosine-protein kinase [Deltaproteobacteria bacterium]|nr:CpsD/CapB family tyrosine-protein kinase [Deltaproteobacteria bacterium]